jgi:electron transport complex protein RnfA
VSYIGIIVSFVFVNNIILSRLLVGKACLETARSTKTALCFGALLVCLSAISCLAAWAVYRGVLVPFGLEYLQTLVFILVITGLTLVLEPVFYWAAKSFFPKKTSGLSGASLFPLAGTNCAVLGICLIAVRSGYTASESLVAGAAAGAGYFLAILLLSVLREAMKKEWIPRPFQGAPITLISAGLMALAFMAFDAALIKNLLG